MKKHLRKSICLLAVLVLLVASTAISFAAEDTGVVSYEGQVEKFLFEPGSEYSKTDLFDEMYKGVMPGDKFEDTITVRNDASDKVEVEIFMRALGATDLQSPEDGKYEVSQSASAEFLKYIDLKVIHEDGTVVFEGNATETSDWVSLGKFKSGEETNLDLEMLVSYDLTAQEQIGALDWQFKVEEFPIIDPTNPTEPTEEPSDETKTGDDMNLILPIALMGVAALVLIIILATRRRKQEQ